MLNSDSSPAYSTAGTSPRKHPVTDRRLPLLNLSTVRARMDSLQCFLSESVNSNTIVGKDQMDMVSFEIFSAIQQIIVNGAALLESSQFSDVETPNLSDSKTAERKTQHLNPDPEELKQGSDYLKMKEAVIDDYGDDCEILEMDAVELLAEHTHFCEICGKGFKRDANLRMHMRAHGNQFKTPEALAKPTISVTTELVTGRKTRFSCPFDGCSRNKKHSKFRPLKSVICVRNHFKRSHCPKMYSCNRCNKKSFSVLADLKSHLKHCGESKWKCSCGTTFSRKDKLFGHMALFEGHMPAVVDEDQKGKSDVVPMEEEGGIVKGMGMGMDYEDNEIFDGLFDGIGSIEGYSLQDVLGYWNGGVL
ncbi:hypothetical protein HS088_TW03G00119 [Tripterygium wilfordii]|uniref:C2H2-type domain-containing protein n=1 Tax=Tripterygium wilfordii TaxID=458696 RepID=A0A7J7DUF2_TRIWF|nr:zinc finger protein STOP1 homolog [Tripterygium wilfordii]KAF5749794.1 hypothetical protein HS088_TW03G00119 [Tripterygium wilfordii]